MKSCLLPAKRSRLKNAPRIHAFSWLNAIVCLGLILATSWSHASPAMVPERADVIMIGDRLVDVAYNLGVVPAAMSVRCSLWPMCDDLKTGTQVLGCPSCLLKKKAAPLLAFAQKNAIKTVLIEKSAPFCDYMPALRLENIAEFLNASGMNVEFADFTNGLEPAVRQTAALLGRTQKADDVMSRYTEAMQKTRRKINGKRFAEKVIIIRGTYQSATGKTFLRIEAPGGYADRFLLTPLGIRNVGGTIIPAGKKPSKGHVAIRKIDGLSAAAPDAIVLTGDAIAVQKALAEAVKRNPALSAVPALRSHAVFSLPGYVDASLIEYPQILEQWADILGQ